MEETSFKITREKHLDHLVKVVPLIVFGYAIHSYLLLQMKEPMSADLLFGMGGVLVMMISSFVIYDVKHEAELFEDRIEVRFLGLRKTVYFRDIHLVLNHGPQDTFGTVMIQTKERLNLRLFFVDDAEKIKQWIEDRRVDVAKAA